jgi:anti-sigma regulatory factor (Ser/Thr protein kinase)
MPALSSGRAVREADATHSAVVGHERWDLGGQAYARQVLREWGLQDLSGDIELIVSELVTNSVRASEGLTGSRYAGQWTPGVPPMRLWIWSDKTVVLIQIWDGDDRMPVRQRAGLHEESGRGLFLVETVCEERGFCPLEEATGKVTWAVITQAR